MAIEFLEALLDSMNCNDVLEDLEINYRNRWVSSEEKRYRLYVKKKVSCVNMVM